MQDLKLRPKLVSFRAVAFEFENRVEGDGAKWVVEFNQEIEIGLAVPTAPGGVIQAIVRINLQAKAHNEQATDETANFKGEYMAKFNYSPDATEEAIAPLLNQEPYQYMLVAQTFPLATTHFRRELLSSGFDVRALPLGV